MKKTTVKLDAATRHAIEDVVREVVTDVVREVVTEMMPPRERYLNSKQLKEWYGMLSDDFLRRHAKELPNYSLRLPMGGAKTRPAYAESEIQKMIVKSTPTGQAQK
jgi:hypothetical protein